MNYKLLRRLLFQLDPERAHRLAIRTLAWLSKPEQEELLRFIERIFTFTNPKLEREVLGMRFRNPVGLAAGFDKDAEAIPALAALGFGFIEVGSVTARPSPGNPRLRLFRLEQDQAIINRLGLPSQGADRVAGRLEALRAAGEIAIPLGVNIAPTTGPQAPRGQAAVIEDYRYSLAKLYRFADYIAINISCPNLPELEFDPQDPAGLGLLLEVLIQERKRLSAEAGKRPLLVKLSPDLSAERLKELVEIALQHGIDGFIAVNTTTSRAGLKDTKLSRQPGGLSGAPLRARAREVVAQLRSLVGREIPIIGVGGIFTAEDAWAMLRAGADLIQLYTGLVYCGPGIVKRINQGLLRLMEERD